MIYIRESYNSKGLLEKTIFYLNAIDEFVFDYKYYEKLENEKTKYYDFNAIDNGFILYMNDHLYIKGYLMEKE